MRTTWRLSGDSSQVLDLLHRRIAEADEVTDIERSGVAAQVGGVARSDQPGVAHHRD